MANPVGIKSGTKGVLLREGVLVCAATSNGSTINRALVESTNKCSEEFRTIEPNTGTLDYTHNFEGFWSEDAGFEACVEDWKTGAKANYTFVFADSGKQDSFSAVIESVSNGYERDTPVSSTIVFKGTEEFLVNNGTTPPPPRDPFYYFFGASGSQQFNTQLRVVPDCRVDDFSVIWNVGTWNPDSNDEAFINQAIEVSFVPTIEFNVFASSDGDLAFEVAGGGQFVTGVPITANTKYEVQFIGTNYEVFVNDVSTETGTFTRGTAFNAAITCKFGALDTTGGNTATLDAVIYNMNIKPLGSSTFNEVLYLFDENSATIEEYYSGDTGGTWENYNAANWQGTP